MDGGDEVGVASDEGMVVNLATVFFFAVEIDGDGTAAEINIFAQVGVAAIDEMREFRPVSDIGIFDFDEVSYLHAVREFRIRTEVNEGTNLVVIAHRAVVGVDAIQSVSVSAADIRKLGIGTDDAILADNDLSLQNGAGVNDGVAADFYVLLDVDGSGVNQGDAVCHEGFGFSAAQNRRGRGELGAGIDAHGLVGVGCDNRKDNLAALN